MQLRVVKTFISRFLILILSFGLVIYSTNMWGSEGKGTISLVIANVAMVSFFSSILAGSSTSFFAKKFKTEELLGFAYLWSILIGILVPLLFTITSFQTEYLFHLMGISVFSSLLSANINLFVGTQNIKLFNIYTVLQQLLHILFILILVYFAKQTHVEIYFIAQIACCILLFISSTWHIVKVSKVSKLVFSKNVFKNMFDYGWKTQLSAFVQFLNYRLSFYFLDYFEGVAAVGIFSIGITFSEAIWTITRSMAVILYSDVVNSKSEQESISKTKESLKIAVLLMIICAFFILIIPSQLYVLIFGQEFSNTKTIMLLLLPGIMMIAITDMIGYYFSAIKQLRILNIKAFVGLFFTVLFSYFLIPKSGIVGACIATTASYCISAGILIWKFYQKTPFRLKDYTYTLAEIKTLKNSFIKKDL